MTMGSKLLAPLLLAMTVATAGCDIETGVPAALESGVLVAKIDGITQDDVQSGVLQKLRRVGQREDNRWTIFVEESRTLCGEDPVTFAVKTVEVGLVAGESTVGSLGEIFSGPVAIQFRDELSGQVATIASRFDVTGKGPVRFNVMGDPELLRPLTPAMVLGEFSVGLAGEAAEIAAAFDLSLSIPISVRAFCPEASE